MHTIYNMQLQNTTVQKDKNLILLFVIVSKCRLNVNSKLWLNVTCDKARLKDLSSAFDDSNGHQMILLTQSWREGCRIPLNLTSKQKLVYGLRKRFFKHLMQSRRSFLWF